MYDHWRNDGDRFKLVFLSCMIIGQMAMTVPSWCSVMLIIPTMAIIKHVRTVNLSALCLIKPCEIVHFAYVLRTYATKEWCGESASMYLSTVKSV